MSDEQPPPSLRLRPRNRDTADAPVTPTTPPVVPMDQGTETLATPAVVSVPDTSPGRFRLKPKITPSADDPGALSASPDSAPVQSAAQDVASVPRLKLKVATSTTSDPVVESIPAARVTPPALVGQADTAVIADALQIDELPAADDQAAQVIISSLTALADSAVVPIEEAIATSVSSSIARATPPPLPTPPPVVVKPVKPKAATSSPRFLILGGLVLLLVAGGAGAYFYLLQEEPPPPPPLVRRAPVTPVPKPVTAEPAVVPPAPTPDSMGLDPLPPAPGAQKAEAAVAAKPIKAPPVPVMTPAFRLWLEGVRINGVTASAGSVPRVIINGRLVRPGDTIDSTEGIVFESVDTEKKCVMFKNRAGFVAAKPY